MCFVSELKETLKKTVRDCAEIKAGRKEKWSRYYGKK
jgi:hypothetical protein